MPTSLSELDLTQLTVDQKLELIGLLWDSIPAEAMPMPEWRRKELERRLAAADQLPNPMPRTGAELVAYWEREGLLGTRTDVTDPVEHARALRAMAEKREHLPEPQKRELDRRIAELDANPQDVRTWEEIKAHVRGRN